MVMQVIEDQPTTPAPADRDGRRRWGFVAGFVLVAAVCGGIGYAASDRDKGGAETHAATSITELPAALERAARAGYGAESELGPAVFTAFDSSLKKLPADRLQDAKAMQVSFGVQGVHTWELFVGASDDNGDPSRVGCGKALGGSVVSCETSKAPDGGTNLTMVMVAAKRSDIGPGVYAVVKDARSLTTDDLPNLRYSLIVKAFHPGGSMTSATENVFAPASLDPTQIFKTSLEELVGAVNDPAVASVPKDRA